MYLCTVIGGVACRHITAKWMQSAAEGTIDQEPKVPRSVRR